MSDNHHHPLQPRPVRGEYPTPAILAEIERQLGGLRFPVDKVHVDDITTGDTVFHEGEVKTVGRQFIKKGGFDGSSIYGDSYWLGTIPVLRVRMRK